MVVSIPSNLRLILVLASLTTIAVAISSSIKTKMNIRYAVLWFVFSLFILILCIFPDFMLRICVAIGMESLTNFLFLVMIAILFIITYYSFVKMSRMSEEIKTLTYQNAVVSKQLEEARNSK